MKGAARDEGKRGVLLNFLVHGRGCRHYHSHGVLILACKEMLVWGLPVIAVMLQVGAAKVEMQQQQ